MVSRAAVTTSRYKFFLWLIHISMGLSLFFLSFFTFFKFCLLAKSLTHIVVQVSAQVGRIRRRIQSDVPWNHDPRPLVWAYGRSSRRSTSMDVIVFQTGRLDNKKNASCTCVQFKEFVRLIGPAGVIVTVCCYLYYYFSILSLFWSVVVGGGVGNRIKVTSRKKSTISIIPVAGRALRVGCVMTINVAI